MTGTLIVAILALVVATTTLVWQIANYVLSGARVRVVLLLGLSDDAKPRPGVLTAPADVWAPENIPTQFALNHEEMREVAVVRVYNRGRIAVTCVHPSLYFGDKRAIGPVATPTIGSPSAEARIEPGDFREWAMDPWLAVKTVRGERKAGTALLVRGRIEDGTGRVRFSSRRRAWKLPADVNAFSPRSD